MELKYIAPSELRAQWEWVRQGLEKIRSKGHNAWLPEDIYCDCFEQRAMLWISPDNGFMVLQPNGKELHVWAAYLQTTDQLESGFEHIKNIARQGNCNKITFSSMRKGWEHRAKQMGFRPRVWEIDI
jgi:hypothetical protein